MTTNLDPIDGILGEVSDFFNKYNPGFYSSVEQYVPPLKEWQFSKKYSAVVDLLVPSNKPTQIKSQVIPPNKLDFGTQPLKTTYFGSTVNPQFTSVTKQGSSAITGFGTRLGTGIGTGTGTGTGIRKIITANKRIPVTSSGSGSSSSGSSNGMSGGEKKDKELCEGTDPQFEMLKYLVEAFHDLDDARSAILNKDVFGYITAMLTFLKGQNLRSDINPQSFIGAVISQLISKPHVYEAEFVTAVCDNLYEICPYFSEKANYFPTIFANFKCSIDPKLALTMNDNEKGEYCVAQRQKFLKEIDERYPGSPCVFKCGFSSSSSSTNDDDDEDDDDVANTNKEDTKDNIHMAVLSQTT
jgi:hypothetical protein